MPAVLTLPPVVAPLNFGRDFNANAPEGYIPPSKRMRMELEAQAQAKKHKASQVRRLRKSADALQPRIDECVKSIKDNKQTGVALGYIATEDKTRLLQSALLVVADGVENGTLPEYLQMLDSKAVVEAVVTNSYPRSGKDMDGQIAALTACGIADEDELYNTHVALLPLLWKRTPEEQHERDIQVNTLKCRQKMGWQEYETTPPVASTMVFKAQITRGQVVLEPSAGLGAIADRIRKWESDITLYVLEKDAACRELLVLKGYEVLPVDDFLTTEFGVTFDRIVMAPPWDKGVDMEHVMVAAELLNPGGRLVALVSKQSFERKDHKGKRYREWVANTGTEMSDVPQTQFHKMNGTSAVILVYNRKGTVI